MKSVLFVCVHNAGRSQMAEAIFNAEAGRLGVPARSASAGTSPGDSVNPIAIQALEEIGIDWNGRLPRLLGPELIEAADRVITMGCGVDESHCPTGFVVSEDWGLDDPAGKSIEEVRRVRDEIAVRVRTLVEELRASVQP